MIREATETVCDADGCTEVLVTVSTTDWFIDADLRRHGWERDGDYWFCPACVARA